jgi:hypothetical protein
MARRKAQPPILDLMTACELYNSTLRLLIDTSIAEQPRSISQDQIQEILAANDRTVHAIKVLKSMIKEG